MLERIEPGAGVGVDIPERLVLLRKVLEQLHDDGMFEDIGMVAGMEGVTIAEHGEAGRR
ncbi:hypothetical protein Tamer19_54890 [Cupriavidus sp. TA19]|nr:hypothetical protein Tamer19_54890 [Cupriavidus sp. TA19]